MILLYNSKIGRLEGGGGRARRGSTSPEKPKPKMLFPIKFSALLKLFQTHLLILPTKFRFLQVI
jgi:hypothetical protein